MLFISCEKLFLSLRYLHFSPDILVMWKYGMMKKLRLISKFIVSQTRQQLVRIHILLNNFRFEGNLQ